MMQSVHEIPCTNLDESTHLGCIGQPSQFLSELIIILSHLVTIFVQLVHSFCPTWSQFLSDSVTISVRLVYIFCPTWSQCLSDSVANFDRLGHIFCHNGSQFLSDVVTIFVRLGHNFWRTKLQFVSHLVTIFVQSDHNFVPLCHNFCPSWSQFDSVTIFVRLVYIFCPT